MSLVGNFQVFESGSAHLRRQSLLAIFQFPFWDAADRFDLRQRPGWRSPLTRGVFDVEPFWRGEVTWGKAPAVDIAEHETAYEITAEVRRPHDGDEDLRRAHFTGQPVDDHRYVVAWEFSDGQIVLLTG